MQSEITVEINSALVAGGRLFYCYGWPQSVVGLILEWNNDVKTIHTAALENDHERFSANVLLGTGGTHEKTRR